LLDALQNASGKPLACVYSVRAHPGATVSTPVTPDELQGNIDPAKWTLKTLDARIHKIGDLWKHFWEKRQTLDTALQALSRQMQKNKSRR
jgi:DNA primase